MPGPVLADNGDYVKAVDRVMTSGQRLGDIPEIRIVPEVSGGRAGCSFLQAA